MLRFEKGTVPSPKKEKQSKTELLMKTKTQFKEYQKEKTVALLKKYEAQRQSESKKDAALSEAFNTIGRKRAKQSKNKDKDRGR